MLQPRYEETSTNPWERYEARKERAAREAPRGPREWELLIRRITRELGL